MYTFDSFLGMATCRRHCQVSECSTIMYSRDDLVPIHWPIHLDDETVENQKELFPITPIPAEADISSLRESGL